MLTGADMTDAEYVTRVAKLCVELALTEGDPSDDGMASPAAREAMDVMRKHKDDVVARMGKRALDAALERRITELVTGEPN